MTKKIIVLFLFATSVLSAQRFNLLTGKLSNLKGISEYNITFDYSELKVHGFETEAAYLKEKMDKRMNVEGKAEKFEKDWYEDRTTKYEPGFITYFNERFENGEVQGGKKPAAKYTMNIKTTWIYPGYSVGGSVEPAKVSAIITVSETANPQEVLVAVEFERSIGIEHGPLSVQGDRIATAYEKLAKNITMQLKRFL